MTKLKPFDYVNDISYNKENLFNSTTEKEYNPYLTNKAFSYFIDTILYANEMNKAVVDPKLQYDYYFYSIRKKKRFAKWHKPESDETVKIISKAYNININRAKEYAALLSEDDISMIKEIINNGGIE
jgi:hypothetical protein